MTADARDVGMGYRPKSNTRNHFSRQFVPGMRFLKFDFALHPTSCQDSVQAVPHRCPFPFNRSTV
eukprot:921103-Rhodomonas_salina.1